VPRQDVGFRVDFNRGVPHDRMLLFAGGRLVASSTTQVRRSDILGYAAKAGFDFRVPLAGLLRSGRPLPLRLFAVAGGYASALGLPSVNLAG
jgi:hypothetical protein